MIMKDKMPWCFIKFSQLILKGNVWRSVWRICMWILGLKGLMLTKDTDGLKLQQRWREAVKYPQRHGSLLKTTLILLILRFRLGTYIPPPKKKKTAKSRDSILTSSVAPHPAFENWTHWLWPMFPYVTALSSKYYITYYTPVSERPFN